MKEFDKNDLFYNRLRLFPNVNFFINAGNVFYNKATSIASSNVSNVFGHPTGYLDVYEMNVDRAGAYIYPFITKNGSLQSFRTVSLSSFNTDFSYGDIMTGSYQRLSATVHSDRYAQGSSRATIDALQNTLNFYSVWSPHYLYSSGLGNKATQELRLLSLTQLFYGSTIQKGSISLKFYITGVLAGELRDSRKNGELIQVSGTNAGSVAGVCLYREGFLVLTGSWSIDGAYTEDYGQGSTNPRWIDFATTSSAPVSSSFVIDFNGTTYTPVITMFAHAGAGELNFSNNPTFLKHRTGSSAFPTVTGTQIYAEEKELLIKNTIKTPYLNPTGTFRKQVFISMVGIYDKDRNLIGVAKLAKPVRKNELTDLTIKMKLDIG